jgi:hypothetical protein
MGYAPEASFLSIAPLSKFAVVFIAIFAVAPAPPGKVRE